MGTFSSKLLEQFPPAPGWTWALQEPPGVQAAQLTERNPGMTDGTLAFAVTLSGYRPTANVQLAYRQTVAARAGATSDMVALSNVSSYEAEDCSSTTTQFDVLISGSSTASMKAALDHAFQADFGNEFRERLEVLSAASDTEAERHAKIEVKAARARAGSKPSECAECGMASARLFACSACQCVWYCGPKCQKHAWKAHKEECTRLLSERTISNQASDPMRAASEQRIAGGPWCQFPCAVFALQPSLTRFAKEAIISMPMWQYEFLARQVDEDGSPEQNTRYRASIKKSIMCFFTQVRSGGAQFSCNDINNVCIDTALLFLSGSSQGARWISAQEYFGPTATLEELSVMLATGNHNVKNEMQRLCDDALEEMKERIDRTFARRSMRTEGFPMPRDWDSDASKYKVGVPWVLCRGWRAGIAAQRARQI
jgi:hypothetical protein